MDSPFGLVPWASDGRVFVQLLRINTLSLLNVGRFWLSFNTGTFCGLNLLVGRRLLEMLSVQHFVLLLDLLYVVRRLQLLTLQFFQ